MQRLLQLAMLAIVVVAVSRQLQAEVPAIGPSAEVGPWPVASQLIGFGGRIWFVNSVKGVNHNSADLYSFSPADPIPRFERALFSQDAGDPLVAGGRLYWPLEDSRSSVGWAEVTLTDGAAWRRLAIPTAQAFHNHAMVLFRGRLIAATSAWRAGFQASADGGLTWQRLYDHPTPDRRVSRVVKLAAAESFFLGHLIDVGRHRVLRSDGKDTRVLEGWPEDVRITAMAGRGDAVFLVANGAEGAELWRSDGETLQKLRGHFPHGRVRDLQVEHGRLWLLTAEGEGGSIWSSTDGLAWEPVLRLVGGTPLDLHVEGASFFIGGTARSGQAAIWTRTQHSQTQRRQVAMEGRLALPFSDETDWNQAADRLDELLAQPGSYRARAILRDQVYRLVLAGPPPGFFSTRLAGRSTPYGTLPLIGGQVQVDNSDLADWLLLWGLGLSGQKGVPVELLLKPWRSSPNGAEKYFEPAPAALWAIVMGRQRDRATITALIRRLGYSGDPDWLRNEVAGTLATLTGQPKTADQASWLEWWSTAETDWKS